MKLRSILLMLSLLAFLSAVAGGFFYYRSLQDAFFDEAKRDAILHVHAIHNFLTQYISDHARIVNVLSGLEPIKKVLVTHESETLKQADDILDRFQKDIQVDVCYLMDYSGITIASSNRHHSGSFVGKDYSFRPYFQEAMGGRGAVYLALGITSGKRGIYFSHPVYGHDQTIPLGVAVIKGSAETISSELLHETEKAHTVQNAVLLIVDPKGVIFFSDRKALLFKTLWKTNLFGLQKISETRQFGKGPWKWSGFKKMDGDQITDGSGNHYFMYAETIESLPGWKIIHLSHLESISSLISNPLLKTAGYLIMGLCALIGVVIFFLNNLAHTEIERRKRAEASLKENEARLRTIIEHSNELFYIYDLKHRLTYASPGSTAILGYTPEEMRGKWTDLATDNPINTKWVKITEKAIHTGEKQPPYVLELRKKDGDTVLLEIDESPIKDHQGEVTGISGAARDVTGRIEAEGALRNSEERYRILVEESFDGVFVHQNSHIIFANGRLHGMLGYDEGALLGLSHLQLYHPDYRELTRKRAQARLRGETIASHYEVKLIRQDGSWLHGEIGARTIDLSGQPGIQVWVKDIHERKQAQQALEESERRMKAILRASPVGIGLVIDRKLNWANETMHRLVGYEKDELLGQSARILYTDDETYARVGRKLYAELMVSGAGQVETRWVRKDHTVFDCMLRACPLNPAEPSKGQIVAVDDISKAKRFEAQLQRAQKMEAIGTLAGGVAHDLNNILSGLVSYPELLLMQIPDDSPLRKPIETIQKSGEKAAAVVQDLLALARRGISVTEVVNINDMVIQYLQSPEYEKLMSFHPHVDVITHLKPDILNILAVPVHLSKTIMNLVSNAAEALPDGGLISVSTENRYVDQPIKGYEDVIEGDYVVLTVSDTGIGISPKDIKKIFEPFYTKKKLGRSGTGLGMTVVWNTVKDHRGYIDVHSRMGKGSSFTLYFPVTRKIPNRENSQPQVQDYRGRGESLLIVDDIEQQRDIATKMLRELGYTVTSVSSGEAAVEYIKDHPVDLVVLDMIMDPGMDGLETYEKIIQIQPAQKCIIASGFSESDRVKEVQRLGAGTYVKKPYLSNKIGLAVRAELDK